MTKQYLTKDGLDKVQQEIEDLKELRKKISHRLEEAIKLGDLSENAEYHDAKDAQGLNESRIRELDDVVSNAEVIKESSIGGNKVVSLGSAFEVKVGNETREYSIVGSQESDPMNGLISNESPIGQALLGHEVGDSVDVETPGGTMQFEIKTIQ